MTGSGFKDHFSSVAEQYSRYRPGYPPEMFGWLTEIAPGREAAWDCATGSGQAAIGLAGHFARVVATDASPEQIARARAHPRIEYRVAPAEASGLPDAAFDLVTVAQALHWLHRPRFYAEARRVLRPGGVLAVWCYNLLEIEPAIDAVVDHFYRVTVGPWWTADRALVDDGYRSVEFPFAELSPPPLAMEADWTLGDLEGYLGSWSAVARYRAERNEDPVAALHQPLARAWGPPEARRRVRWPLHIRAGHVFPFDGAS